MGASANGRELLRSDALRSVGRTDRAARLRRVQTAEAKGQKENSLLVDRATRRTGSAKKTDILCNSGETRRKRQRHESRSALSRAEHLSITRIILMSGYRPIKYMFYVLPRARTGATLI